MSNKPLVSSSKMLVICLGLFLAAVVFSCGTLTTPKLVYAGTPPPTCTGANTTYSTQTNTLCVPATACPSGTTASSSDGGQCTVSCPSGTTYDSNTDTCGTTSGIYTEYVQPFIALLSGLVGLVVAISLVVAGIQYSSSGGDPSKVAAAKKRIYNAIIALLAYLFLFAFLQWLIPGGLV